MPSLNLRSLLSKPLLIAVVAAVVALGVPRTARGDHQTVHILGQEQGVTPFIWMVSAFMDNPAALDSYQFTVRPKPGSQTRPISARYSSATLKQRGFLYLDSNVMTLPVYGLYQNRANVVTVTFRFADGRSQSTVLHIQTQKFDDPHRKPEVLQARSANTTLSYDFILLKNFGDANSPLIIDTDGEVRWVGVGDNAASGPPSCFYRNAVYAIRGAVLERMELDGVITLHRDFAPEGVAAFHHDINFGRDGLLMAIDTPSAVESIQLEVNAKGDILRRWDFGEIIAAAIRQGGQDPAGFVQPYPVDWFHHNSSTYFPTEEALVVSSRENFVMAINYRTGAIKWILGDQTKHWHDYAGLSQYALQLAPGSLPPIGQHSVSIDRDRLLLFDDGFTSLAQTPAGDSRTYSAPRMYRLNPGRKMATEVWNYENGQNVYSPICSSVYSDQENNYLIEYSTKGPYLYNELIGLDETGSKVFDYQYPLDANYCASSWNAAIIHLEDLEF